MAAPDPLRGTEEEFSGENWRQIVGKLEPAGDSSFSKTHGEGALAGLVKEPKTRGALRFALGWDAVEPSVGTVGDPAFVPAKLLRTNPVPHPKHPELFCTGASELGLAPDGQGALRDLRTFGQLSLPLGNRLGGGALGVRAKYKESRIGLRFEPLAWDLGTDAGLPGGVTSERERNVVFDQESRTELLSLSGFTLTYAEGSNLPAATHSSPGGAVGVAAQSFPAEIGQVLVKSDCTLTWYDVPERWIFFPGTKKPTRMLARLGTLNDADFFGYGRGTLLFSSLKLTRYPWTLRVAPRAGDTAVESRHQYTVTMGFTWFDPPRGFDGAGANALDTIAPQNKGWNCKPWRGSIVAPRTSDPQAGKWFICTWDGRTPGAGGVGQHDYTSFSAAFDAAENATASGV